MLRPLLLENDDVEAAAKRHSRLLLKRAESGLTLDEDIEAVSKSAQWSGRAAGN